MISSIVDYPDFVLCNYAGNKADEISEPEVDKFYRVELPYSPQNYVQMANKGYLYVERTLGVTINLKKNDIDFSKMVRFDIRPLEGGKESILDIALNSFPFDRRFHVRPLPDDAVAGAIICKWVDELSEIYVCIHKDDVVGFLDLEPYGDNGCFIHLAAVKERYRAAGAAVSLYAFAVTKAKEKGCEKLCGRISSGNTAVMNLYARLGGVFSDPVDIFVRNEI